MGVFSFHRSSSSMAPEMHSFEAMLWYTSIVAHWKSRQTMSQMLEIIIFSETYFYWLLVVFYLEPDVSSSVSTFPSLFLSLGAHLMCTTVYWSSLSFRTSFFLILYGRA